jgi:hypothetical protein
VALLCHQGVSLAAVWDLTRDQVRRVYFREWTEQGQLVPLRPAAEAPSYADQARDLYRRRAWPEHRIDSLLGQLREG